MSSLVKLTVLFTVASISVSVLVSFIAGEFIVKHINPQSTFSETLKEGLSIFQPSEVTPFTVLPNLNTIHLGYTREFKNIVHTNNAGFRGQENVSEIKPSEVYRILVLGDSMTFGWGVEDEETYSAVLERNLNILAQATNKDLKFEVLNGGFIGGYGQDGFYAYYNRFGQKLQPDIVVVSFFPYNDFSDLANTDWEEIDRDGMPVVVRLPDTAIKYGRLAKSRPTEWKFAIPGLRNSHLAILLMRALEKYSPSTVDSLKKILYVDVSVPKITQEKSKDCVDEDKCNEILLESKRKLKFVFAGMNRAVNKSGTFLALMIPDPQEVSRYSGFIGEKKKVKLISAVPQKEFRDFFEQEKIRYLDALPVLSDKKTEKYFYERDGHFNARGHGRVAEALFEYLIDNRLLGVEVKTQQLRDLKIQGVLKF